MKLFKDIKDFITGRKRCIKKFYELYNVCPSCLSHRYVRTPSNGTTYCRACQVKALYDNEDYKNIYDNAHPRLKEFIKSRHLMHACREDEPFKHKLKDGSYLTFYQNGSLHRRAWHRTKSFNDISHDVTYSDESDDEHFIAHSTYDMDKKLHCEDGPACIIESNYTDIRYIYSLHGQYYTYTEWLRAVPNGFVKQWQKYTTKSLDTSPIHAHIDYKESIL